MYINSDMTLGHSKAQYYEAKESKGCLHSPGKNEHRDGSKDGVLMFEIREEVLVVNDKFEVKKAGRS